MRSKSHTESGTKTYRKRERIKKTVCGELVNMKCVWQILWTHCTLVIAQAAHTSEPYASTQTCMDFLFVGFWFRSFISLFRYFIIIITSAFFFFFLVLSFSQIGNAVPIFGIHRSSEYEIRNVTNQYLGWKSTWNGRNEVPIQFYGSSCWGIKYMVVYKCLPM